MKTILIHGLGQTAGAWNKTTELLPQEDVLARSCPHSSAAEATANYTPGSEDIWTNWVSRCSCAGCRWARFWR